MKRILFLSVLGCIISSFMYNMSARNIEPNGPSHPLKPVRIRYTCDTVYVVTPSSLFKMIINHSADGLTDTIYGMGYVPIERYNEKNQLIQKNGDGLLLHDLVSGDRGAMTAADSVYPMGVIDYEYDSQGRVSKYTDRFVYLSGKDSITSEKTYDYSTVEYTEKGYIFEGSEYELDELSRVTHIKSLARKGETKELYGKAYRVEEPYYSYFEGGVSHLRYTWNWVSPSLSVLRLGWVKSDYYFREDGYRVITNMSVDDGKTWELFSDYDYQFIYADDMKINSIPDGNENAVSSANVYGALNEIVVNSVKNAQVYVYNMVGQVVRQAQTVAGTTRFTVPKGLYVVTVGGESYKVAVK